MFRTVLLAAALLGFSLPAQGARLEIRTRSGPHVFDVEEATTPAARERGLMFRRTLDPDRGMIFVFDPPREVVMWMHNTYIPLDMVFADAQARVLRVERRAVPLSDAHIPSGGEARYVVELAGGTAARIGLAPGDRLAGEALTPPR